MHSITIIATLFALKHLDFVLNYNIKFQLSMLLFIFAGEFILFQEKKI